MPADPTRSSVSARLALALAAASLAVLIAIGFYAWLTDLYLKDVVLNLSLAATVTLAVAIVWLHWISRRYWVYGGAFLVTLGVFGGGFLWPIGVIYGALVAGLSIPLLLGWHAWRRESGAAGEYRDGLIYLAVSVVVGALSYLEGIGKSPDVYLFILPSFGLMLPFAALLAVFIMFADRNAVRSPVPAALLLAAGAVGSIPFVRAWRQYPDVPGIDPLILDGSMGLMGVPPLALIVAGLALLWLWIETRLKNKGNRAP